MHVCVIHILFPVLEKSEFKDESLYFRFYADEEMEGTSSKSKQLRNDFKLVENILGKSLLVRNTFIQTSLFPWNWYCCMLEKNEKENYDRVQINRGIAPVA